MIRIVAVQKSANPDEEFVLLQNQGSLRISLRGHVVLSECSIDSEVIGRAAHVFSDEEKVPAGMYILLRSGSGSSRWTKTKDGSLVYYAYMGRTSAVWEKSTGPLHLLGPQHTFAERREMVALH
jgi:hypothetical protein